MIKETKEEIEIYCGKDQEWYYTSKDWLYTIGPFPTKEEIEKAVKEYKASISFQAST